MQLLNRYFYFTRHGINFDLWSQKTSTPTLFLVVAHLPKNSLVEKQVLLHTGRVSLPDEDDGELVVQRRTPIFEQGTTSAYH